MVIYKLAYCVSYNNADYILRLGWVTIQRKFGIGSILLNTAATESHGIRLRDIENSDDFYKKIDGIIHAS